MSNVYTEIKQCRVCGDTYLPLVIDLGVQCLQGQFPKPDQPDPPSAPLQVVRCITCGLMQSRYSVDLELQFREYMYRSSVSATMKSHLKALAIEACEMVGGITAPRILDIGANDGFTLDCIPAATGVRIGIDPSDVPIEYPGIKKVHGFFPNDFLLVQQFDLILSIACFYDSDTPVEFAKAVKTILSPNGIWVVEVADQFAVMQNNAFDYFCFEHAGLYSPYTMTEVAQRSGLKIVRAEPNVCNGGSMRYYLTHRNNDVYASQGRSSEWNARIAALWAHGRALKDDAAVFERFASQIKLAKLNIVELVRDVVAAGKKVHLLGASTKLQTVLQYAGLDRRVIEMASDRDERKVGRVTPGTRIPIVSEAASRAAEPSLYIGVLTMFRTELVARERAAGTKADICFLLPQPEIVKA